MESDFELVDAWRAGDRTAGNQLLRRHFNSLFRFFRSKVDAELAQDLIQQTMLASIEAQARFRKASSFRAFLFAIARNKLYGYFRDKKPGADVGVTSLHDLGASPTADLAVRQEQRLLLEALRRLPLDLQIIVELYYWEELTGSALAEVLEVPEGTARSRLRRARERLLVELRALAKSKELLDSTVTDLEKWSRSLRELFGQAA